MVKGTARQVIVVNGTGSTSFDQAFFLVKDKVITEDRISEADLLKEARQVCRSAVKPLNIKHILWLLSGSALTGSVWLLTSLLN